MSKKVKNTSKLKLDKESIKNFTVKTGTKTGMPGTTCDAGPCSMSRPGTGAG